MEHVRFRKWPEASHAPVERFQALSDLSSLFYMVRTLSIPYNVIFPLSCGPYAVRPSPSMEVYVSQLAFDFFSDLNYSTIGIEQFPSFSFFK